MYKKAVFFDRDGIIVEPINGEAPTKVGDLKLITQIISVIKKVKQLGFLVIVVSNQPDIAFGKITQKTLFKLEEKFLKLLSQKKLSVDAVYYCHHHPQGTVKKYTILCKCRKPQPGMIFKASKKYQIDLTSSLMVGDRATDIEAGKLAGVKTILFDPLKSQTNFLKKNLAPDFSIKNLKEIVPIIEREVGLEAIILAAGKGERMLPLTRLTPKPLLKINGIPMMEYTIRLLSKNGFKNIGTNLFYRGDKIKDYFRDGKKWGVSIRYVKEKNLTGSAGGVKKILQRINTKNPILVIASDMMTNFNLKKIYKYHLEKGGIATICCFFRPLDKLTASKSGLIVFDKTTKQILKFVEKPQSRNIISQWVNSSVYVFDPEIINYIPDRIDGRKIVDFGKDVFPKLLRNGKKVFAYPVIRKYYQLGVDTPERINMVEEDIKSGRFIPVNFQPGL